MFKIVIRLRNAMRFSLAFSLLLRHRFFTPYISYLMLDWILNMEICGVQNREENQNYACGNNIIMMSG